MIISYPLFLGRVLALFACVYLAAVLFFTPGMSALGWGSLGLGLVVLLTTSGLGVRYRTLYDAHWATRRETRPFQTTLEQSGTEFLLGFAFGQLVSLKPGAFGRRELGHALICGPARSGKSLGLRCNLLSWAGSAVVVDLKGELYRTTAGYREQELGQRVFVIRPSEVRDADSPEFGQHRSHRYDPFSELKSDEFIRAVASSLLNAEGDGENAIFALRAINALFAGIKGAHLLGKPVLSFIQDLTGYGYQAYCLELYKIPDESLRRAIRDFLGGDPLRLDWDNIPDAKFLANAWQNMIAKLQFLFTPATLRVTAGSDFHASELFAQPTTVYLIFEESELETSKALFQAVFTAFNKALVSYADAHPNKERVPVLELCDEAGAVVVPNLEGWMSTVAGRGISIAVYLQSLAQLDAKYGANGATTIKDNAHTKIFFAPEDVEVTGKYLSEQCGQLMAEDSRHGVDHGEGTLNASVGLRPRELITPDECKALETHECIALMKGVRIRAHRLEPWLLTEWQRRERLQPSALPLCPELAGSRLKPVTPSKRRHAPRVAVGDAVDVD